MCSSLVERLGAPRRLPLKNDKPRQMAGLVCGLRLRQTGSSTRRRSGVLADTGHQPGLVLALSAFHAPALAERLALVEARGLGDAGEGQGGGGLLGIVGCA